MALRDDLEDLLEHIKKTKGYRRTNFKLIDIFEGNLKPHLEMHLMEVLSPKQAVEAAKFIVPINVLQKIIDKLSKIYQQQVTRRILDGRPEDSELLVWYEDNFRINQMMNISNEFFNLTKTTLVEPYIEDGSPKLRVIPNDRFIPYSNNMVNPTKLTHLTVVLAEESHDEERKAIYLTWTDEEVIIWDSGLKIRVDLMERFLEDMPDGVNRFGRIPYVYVNQSSNLLIPKHDTDVLTMTLEIPNQLTYLNYGVGYNAFPITYGIDIDDEGLERAPNAFWSIKSDPDSDKTPQVNTIKPVIDISETLNFIQSELAFWLNTKGIRPGAIGSADAENFVSGISKIVDEMDTVEARKKQIEYFENAEMDLWDLVFNHMHPYWSQRGLIENNTVFTPTALVQTEFLQPTPLETRGDLVANLQAEISAGFISRKRAMKKLNPEMSEDEIEELLEEIDEEKTVEIPEAEEAGQEKERNGETTLDEGHSHVYQIDASGNGSTSTADGHAHEIINEKVQPMDGHTHGLLEESADREAQG